MKTLAFISSFLFVALIFSFGFAGHANVITVRASGQGDTQEAAEADATQDAHEQCQYLNHSDSVTLVGQFEDEKWNTNPVHWSASGTFQCW